MRAKIQFVVLVIFQLQLKTYSESSGGASTCIGNEAFKILYDMISNTGEFDPLEAKHVYKISRHEIIMPTFAMHEKIYCDPAYPYRSYDGSCNNLLHTNWGKANSTYIRLEPARYGDGIRTPRRGYDDNNLPGARKVRTELFPTGSVKSDHWNLNSMIFGQFMSHDMSLLKDPPKKEDCCSPDVIYGSKKPSRYCFPIKVPDDDPTMGRDGHYCMNFSRTVTDKDYGYGSSNAPANQINTVTSHLDLSMVYGLTKKINQQLRTLRGGRLKTECRNGVIYLPKEKATKEFCLCAFKNNDSICYKTGDSRGNQNTQITILQTIFAKEHNRIADGLSRINPHWNDERLFQEARKILIAMYQRIVYYEWLPYFNGRKYLIKDKIIYDNEFQNDFIDDYDIYMEAAIYQEHAQAAFRSLHSLIEGQLELMNILKQTTGVVDLSKWLSRPRILELDPNNMASLTRGLLYQSLQAADTIYVPEITDKLFACEKKYGIDLKATDIQRDRDHALNYYNVYRKLCGFNEAESFDDYCDLISPENIEKLKTLYTDYKDVDLSVGGSLEKLVRGTVYGPTFLSIVNKQFYRTRVSDRFFFENPSSGFTLKQLQEIRKATISRIFCNSADGIYDIQRNGFLLPSSNINEIVSCKEIPGVDLNAWAE